MLPHRLAPVALLATLSAGAAVQAAEWSLDPEVSVRARYDDNYRLTADDKLPVWETALLPKITFARSTENSRMTGVAGFNLRRFDEDGLDTNDRFLNFMSSHAGERSRWGLNATYTLDDSLGSELVEEQLFLNRVPRERWSLSPSWSHSLSETIGINASYQYVDVSYPNAPDNQLYAGFQHHTANLGLGYSLSSKTRLISQLGLSRSERSDDTLSSDTRQLTLGLEHQFSERLSGSTSVGTGRTETDFQQSFRFCSAVELPGFFFGVGGSVCFDPNTQLLIPYTIVTDTITARSSNTIYNADLRYQLETGELTVSASSSITPYTNGGMTRNERFGLSGLHRFSSRLQASLSLDWYRTRNTDDISSRLDRTTVSLRPSLRWRLDRDWTLTTGYRYFRQEYEGSIDSATSNAVDLTLTYHWPRYAISR